MSFRIFHLADEGAACRLEVRQGREYPRPIFEGTTVEEAERAFRESVDDYLEFCRERGERARAAALGQVPGAAGAGAAPAPGPAVFGVN